MRCVCDNIIYFFPHNEHAIVITLLSCNDLIRLFIHRFYHSFVKVKMIIDFSFRTVVYTQREGMAYENFPQTVVKSGMRPKVASDSNTCSEYIYFFPFFSENLY